MVDSDRIFSMPLRESFKTVLYKEYRVFHNLTR
jgi:hypothetical protein